MKLITLISFLVGLGLCDDAWARPEFQISPDMTTKAVLDACGSNDPSLRAEPCELIFSGLLKTAYHAAGSPMQDPATAICFPGGGVDLEIFRSKIIVWLNDHAEVQSLPFISDGSRLAVIGAYACH